ncbi:MAG: 16S rRNA (cytidine(1402)-2'-O)-methyltransferase [Clostridia bacterium]|nr:16S rRNA (cytidine(1402)-2'-O)-methyltransferase [Clostridia bacterium]
MNNEILPKLYLCGTPIGNLGDITFRAAETLRKVEKIYCEDTRNTMKLLSALDIKKPLESCHEHNERQRAAQIAAEVRSGKAVAFVSDAGMPGVSDPGSRLVSEFIREGLPFEVVPGPSAVLTAWVASGLPTERLYFVGFLPRTGAERTEAIARIIRSDATSAVYESPLRVGATLAELRDALRSLAEGEQERPCALVRELTKTFEECIRGSVSELADRFAEEPPRGECVLLIGGADDELRREAALGKLDRLLSDLLGEGLSVKTAVRIASETLDLPKNLVYNRATEPKDE